MKISNNMTYNFEKTANYTKDKLNSKTFAAKMDAAQIDNSRSVENAISKRDIYVTKNNEDLYNVGIYGKKNTENQLELPIETERYKIELCNEVEGVQAYLIHDKLLGKQLYIREDELVIQRDGGTGMEFIINMDQPFFMKLQVTDELKNILHEIETKRNIDIEEIPMQGGLYVNRDAKTGIQYLAIRGNEGKGAGLIITSEKELEAISKLMKEFQQYSVSSQESTAELYAMLEITGNLRRGNEGFTFLTPMGITYIPYDGDSKKAWEINMSEQNYSAARESLAAGTDFENSNVWLQILSRVKNDYGSVDVWNYYSSDREGKSYNYKFK